MENRLKEKDDKLCEVDRELRKERESLKKIQLLNATMQREIEDLKSRENARNETACTNGEKLKVMTWSRVEWEYCCCSNVTRQKNIYICIYLVCKRIYKRQSRPSC